MVQPVQKVSSERFPALANGAIFTVPSLGNPTSWVPVADSCALGAAQAVRSDSSDDDDGAVSSSCWASGKELSRLACHVVFFYSIKAAIWMVLDGETPPHPAFGTCISNHWTFAPSFFQLSVFLALSREPFDFPEHREFQVFSGRLVCMTR